MRRIMRSFKLDEISGVDRPAQAHARAAIMKRDITDVTKKPAAGLFAIGKDNDLLKKLGLLKGFGVNTKTLATSLKSIVEDPDAADKGALVEETIKQFTEAVEGDLVKDLSGLSDNTIVEDRMSPALAKALGLADTASEDEIVAAIAANKADLAKAKADADAIVKAAHDAEIAKAVAEKDALAKRLEVLEGERELASFAKKADEAGLPVSKADMLLRAYKGDKAALDEFVELYKAASKALDSSELLKEYGSAKAMPSDETTAITAKAAELRKADPSLTEAQAFSRAYTDPANKALAKAERAKNRPFA